MRRKLFIVVTLALTIILGACTAPKMIQSQEEAKNLSINKLVMYQGIIYKDGFEYGKFSEIKTDVLDELITYQKSDGTEVATLTLKGVSPETGELILSTGKRVILNKREMEIDVTKDDGALYLIKHMYLSKKANVVNNEVLESNSFDSNINFELKNKETHGKIEKKKDYKLNTKVVVNKIKGDLDLRYIFKAGNSYNYHSVENSSMMISMSAIEGMGDLMGSAGGAEHKMMTDTHFTLKIVSVNNDGSANFEMVINSFKSYLMPSKQLIASDAGMKGLKAKGIITPKGEVTFLEDVYIVITKKDERFLVKSKVSANGVSATSQNGDEEVKVEASFDPKTGALTASVNHRKVKRKPSVKVIKVTQEDNKIDILPKQLMKLFLLPKEKVAVGQKVTFKTPGLKSDFLVVSKDNNLLKLKSNFKTDMKEMTNNMDPEMSNDMQMNMKMNADVNYDFDIQNGVLEMVEGVINTTMKGNGMDMKLKSTITMKLEKNNTL